MTNKSIILSSSKAKEGLVVLPLKKWQKMEKELWELRHVTKVVLESEQAIREGNIRPFKAFAKEWHAKNT